MSRILNLFRMVNGVRVAYRFLVDDHDTILEEHPVVTTVSERELDLQRRGIAYTLDADGGLTINSIPDRERKILGFFSGEPCFFEGCEQLREEYQSEVARLGKDCPSCEKGALMRKFHERVSSLIP